MTVASLETWSARGARRRVLDHQLFVVDVGVAGAAAATPALLVHGFPTSAHDWSPILDELATERRVVACDLLGFGLSDKPWPHRYSLGEQADLVSELARSLDLRHVHLVAHDMGDTVVQELLARQLHGDALPFTIASVTLLNGGVLVDRVRPILGQRLLRQRALRPLLERLPPTVARRLYYRSMRTIAGPDRPPPAGELEVQFELSAGAEGVRLLPHLIGYMREREVHRDRWRRSLLTHPYPMLLVWGDADPINPWPVVEEIQRERPATESLRLERAGHYPQLERPVEVAAAIRAHLRRHD